MGEEHFYIEQLERDLYIEGTKLTTAYDALRDVSKELADANDIIQRVRELAEHWVYEGNRCGDEQGEYGDAILAALDGSHE